MQFTYRAKQDQHTEASGVIDAVDLTAAVRHLKQMGLYPLEVVPLESQRVVAEASFQKRPLTRTELSLWARTVGQGLKAGLSLTQALHLLAEQEKSRPVGQATKLLEEKVTAGVNLGDAMRLLADSFSPVAVSLVRSGEASGALEQVLEALAVQVEGEAELIEKVRGALIYPIFVLTIAMIAVAVQDRLVVPTLTTLFAENGQSLPWITQTIIMLGRLMVSVVGGSLLLGLVLFIGNRSGWWKLPLAQWMMMGLSRLPNFGRLIAHAEIARLASTLGLLLGHGLPLPESLRLAAGTVGRAQLKSQVEETRRLVIEGTNLSAGFSRVGLREPFLLTMVAMGEAQGDLALSFQQAAARYHAEVDRGVKILSTLIEPIMILVVGLIVGGIVFSMLLPIFQINFTVG